MNSCVPATLNPVSKVILRVALLLSSTQAPSAPGSVGQSGSVCSGAMLSSTMCASSGRVNLDVNATGIRVASSPTPGAPGQHHDDGLGSNVVQHIGHGGRRSVVFPARPGTTG